MWKIEAKTGIGSTAGRHGYDDAYWSRSGDDATGWPSDETEKRGQRKVVTAMGRLK